MDQVFLRSSCFLLNKINDFNWLNTVQEAPQMSNVYIDLDATLDVRRLVDVNELIQQKAYERFSQLLSKRLASLDLKSRDGKPFEEDRQFADRRTDDDGTRLFIDRRQNAIAIHGGRGTGKTTFVRNAFTLLKNNHGIAARMATLGVVDPTLIENKENVFVIVINKIRDAVDRYYETFREYNLDTKRDDLEENYEHWRKSLRELAGGLMLLEGISSDKPLADGWDDKQYILQRGLDKVRDAAGLEQKFHVFIERSLNFISKECFLMAFDDVDTDFSRGWPVLEVIRRYLTSPRWITVVCGDLDLFAILVLGKQWANFEKKILKYDHKALLSLGNMVAHLQSQYLLKVLRPDNRITLLPLGALTDQVTVGRGPSSPKRQKRRCASSQYASARGAQVPHRLGVSAGRRTFAAAARPDGASGAIAGP
jgi:hypothetical protein